MKFGLLMQMEIPKPWPDGVDVDHRIHWQTLEQGIVADQAGFDYFWLTEHHFYEEIGHCSAPEVFLAALAMRTERIRLGHGVVVLPANHPIRVAERAATLDIMSNGRLDLGTGRGSSLYHIEPFHFGPDDSKEVWDESMRVICSLFLNETFPGHQGKYFDLPPRKLIPKPYQKPHPPLWVAAARPETFAHAGRTGLGVLGFVAMAPEELLPAVAAYREEAANADPANFYGAFATNQIAAIANAYCDTDDRRGRTIGGAATRWYLGDNDAPLNAERFGPNFSRELFTRGAVYGDDALVESGILVGGDPDTCSRVIERWEKAGIDQLMFLIQAGNTTHEQVMRSIELFGDKVLPRFAERQPVG
jgi:alkanesulfonate monooxygenase SsuD/methylene tetrahydromethanopterin reductase-like flavin-dependent oxidoreductase (luciferase family)